MNGEQLKSALSRTGKSNSDIARLMGVKLQSLYASFESKEVKTSTLERICQALNKDIAWFYEGTPYGVKTESLQDNGQEAVTALIDQLEEKDRQLHAKDVQIDNLMALLAAQRGIKVREAS